jgi:hypothetical protein
MRRILGLCVVLALSTAPAYAWQEPVVNTPVPNIHAPGATAVTTPYSTVLQGTTAAPAATTMTNQGTMVTNQGTMVAAQPGAPIVTPTGNTTYYYYRNGLFGRRYRVAAPATTYVATAAPVYTAPVQTYSTPVRRRWPFGLFQRRFNQPMSPYTTTYTTPGYYTTAGNYAPTVYTNTVPTPGTVAATGTAPTATTPAYVPTTLNVPNSTTAPAGSVPTSEAFTPIIPKINPR